MIRKVSIDKLKSGMFIHDFNCDWNGENIYIDQALLKDDRMIEIIRSWGIREVYIDTERGIDVETARAGKPSHTSAASGSTRKVRPTHSRPSVPFTVEVNEAKKIRNDALTVIQDSMEKTARGETPDIDLTYAMASRMKASIDRNRDALLLLTRIRKKDEYTLFHSISVSSLVLTMCSFKSFSESRSLDLAVGALFHDIGKTKIPDTILNKPAKLAPEEFRRMQKHVEYSVDLLRGARGLPFECYDIALHHHERFDGSGYPHGLMGDNISLGAQLTSVCDVYDAITSARCYKEGMGTVSGLKQIYELSGSHFKRELAHEFIECIGVYPVGSCVQLTDGKIGVVADSTGDLLRPLVKVFYDTKKEQRCKPSVIDLSKTEHAVASYANARQYGIQPATLLNAVMSPASP